MDKPRIGWFFPENDRLRRARNPITGEHFAGEAIADTADAVVREAVQNSLDARADPSSQSPIRVRFALSGSPGVSPQRMDAYTKGLWRHLESEDNGLREPPERAKPCRFLTIEDFGTTGLLGDPACNPPTGGETSDLYHFWRAEGLTAKSSGNAGSWGIGKAAFNLASRANLFFFLTVRSDDRRRLLAGTAVLKIHEAGGRRFEPDGWFGNIRGEGERTFDVLPVSDDALMDGFVSDFGLSRGGEPGLSVVVPWVDDDLTSKQLREAVIRSYFLAVLNNLLEVEVMDGGRAVQITSENILSLAQDLDRDTLECVRLAAEARSYSHGCYFPLDVPFEKDRPVWTGIPGELPWISDAGAQFRAGGIVGFRIVIPVVRRDSEAPERGELRIFLKRVGDTGSRNAVFERGGILIRGATRQALRGVTAITRIERGALANLLRDAENPAHTEWTAKTEHFKDRYKWGPAVLSFVKDAPVQLCLRLEDSRAEVDRVTLAEFFPRLAAGMQVPAGGRATKGSRIGPGIIEPDLGGRQEVRMTRSGTTVAVSGTLSKEEPRKKARLLFAYDRATGDPFRKWSPLDFSLSDQEGLRVASSGARVIKAERNEVELEFSATEFHLEIDGFDARRDVVVKWR